MKNLALLALLLSALFAAPAFAQHKASQIERDQVLELAERPVAIVKGDKCEIRGAVWAYGPRSGALVALTNVLTGETFRGRTNAAGIYSITTPYPGVPVVYAERLDEPVFVRKEVVDTFAIVEGGVVCDHRLTAVSAHQTQHKEQK